MTLLEVATAVLIFVMSSGVFGWAWSTSIHALGEGYIVSALSDCIADAAEDVTVGRAVVGTQTVAGFTCKLQAATQTIGGVEWVTIAAHIQNRHEEIWLRR